MTMKIPKPSTYAKMEKMSDDQLTAYFNKRLPLYRRALARLTSFLKQMVGRAFKGKHLATAADVEINVSGGTGPASPSAGGTSLTVQKFEHPGPRKLASYIDALEQIEYIGELDYQINRYADTENKALQKVQKLRVSMYNGLVDAYVEAIEAMRDIAKNKLPEPVGNLFKAAKKYFDPKEAEFVESYMAANNGEEPEHALDYYINVGVKDAVVDIVFNADISHWPRETKEGLMVAVITVRLEPTEDAFTMKAYANVLDRVGLPGRYNIGTEMKGADIPAIAKKIPRAFDMELAAHNVISFMAPVDLKLDETEVEERLMKIEGISGVVVNPNGVEIEMDDDRGTHRKAMEALDALPSIKKLTRAGYSRTLANPSPGIYLYSLTLKS